MQRSRQVLLPPAGKSVTVKFESWSMFVTYVHSEHHNAFVIPRKFLPPFSFMAIRMPMIVATNLESYEESLEVTFCPAQFVK
jgi:hypothetical protein